MLYKTGLRILKLLFEDWTRDYTIREISLTLKLPYPQTHRTITSLIEKKLIKKEKKGKSWLISLILEQANDPYISIEIERKKDILNKYKIIRILTEDLERVEYNQFICLLFGSYAGKNPKKDSDIDLLFIIPEEYNYEKFEKTIKDTLTPRRIDINITTEKGLIEMWHNPLRLNVGNEILKKHVVLFGAEQFLRLRREYYVG